MEVKNSQLSMVHDRVLALVRKYPKARSNYAFLVLSYWNEYEGASFVCPSLEVLTGLTSPESLTRAFRKVQADHPELRPPPSVQELRAEMEEIHRRAWTK